MTTTIDLTDQEIAELKSLTNQPDAVAAVRCATTEYLRFARGNASRNSPARSRWTTTGAGSKTSK